MDLSIPGSTPNSPLTPVFGDNVQDLLGTGALNVNPNAIITVNSIADTVDDPSSGVITLRDAINQANADNGQDLIVFDRSVFSSQQTITLSGTELDITHNLDIIAPRDSLTGGDLVTVSGNNASRVFEIGTGAGVNIDGLIVADGNVTESGGGGILNSGILTLDNSIVSGNKGDGIYNSAGTVEVNNSSISGNMAGTGSIFESSSSTFGFSGGIYNFSCSVEVNNSSISCNTWLLCNGGGIYNIGILNVNNSTISGNKTSGMYRGNGGGIYNSYRGISTIVFSTITLNQATNGGGVYQDSVPPTSTSQAGSFSVRNTIIASNLNSDGGVNPDVSGTFTSNGYNLIGDSTGSTGFGTTGDIVGTSDNPIDPRLAPLDFNGGSTQTIALLPDSPAIGAGDPTVLDTDPTTDQRGLPRRALDGSTDIGAFEFSSWDAGYC